MRYISTTFCFIFLINLTTTAQISYENRIEFELKDGYNTDGIEPLGKNGFLMVSENDKSRNGETEWQYQLFGTNLELKQTKSIYLDKKYSSSASISAEASSHTLYKNPKKGEYTLVTFNSLDGKIIQKMGKLPKKIIIKETYVMGDLFYVTGILNKSPVVFSIDWKTGKQNLFTTLVPGVKPKKTSIVNFQTLHDSKEVFIYMKAEIGKKESEITVLKFKATGEKLGQFTIQQKSEKNLISLSATKIGNDEYILNGTYSESSVSSSEGIFTAKIKNQKIDYIKYYNFVNLKDFLSYLPKKKQDKINKKKKRKAKRGKELTIDYNIANHKIITVDDGYVFLGEAFIPTYYTYSSTTYVNGVATTTYTTVFDGYLYTHAIVAKFNKSGDLLWDRSFEMKPSYKPYSPKLFISIAEQDSESMKMVFANSSKIVSKSIRYSDGEIINDKSSKEIETGSEDDKTKRTFSYIDYWYDNYFLAYGNQTIKNKEHGKRKIFFISKIAY